MPMQALTIKTVRINPFIYSVYVFVGTSFSFEVICYFYSYNWLPVTYPQFSLVEN